MASIGKKRERLLIIKIQIAQARERLSQLQALPLEHRTQEHHNDVLMGTLVVTRAESLSQAITATIAAAYIELQGGQPIVQEQFLLELNAKYVELEAIMQSLNQWRASFRF